MLDCSGLVAFKSPTKTLPEFKTFTKQYVAVLQYKILIAGLLQDCENRTPEYFAVLLAYLFFFFFFKRAQ